MEFVEEIIDREISDYELERGKPMPSKNHGKLQARLSYELMLKYRKVYDILSEYSIQISEGKDKVPDLTIIPVEESDWMEDEIRATTAPLCVIEIVSPSQSTQDLVEKLPLYFEIGVKSAWIVLPIFKTIYVFDAPKNYKTFMGDLLYDEVLGIELSLKEVFK